MTATTTPTPGLVARWTTRRPPLPGQRCGECGEALDAAACAGCGQLAGQAVAMLATVIQTRAGARLIIAEHSPDGWTPLRTMTATPANVAALSRPGATGPTTPASSTVERLW